MNESGQDWAKIDNKWRRDQTRWHKEKSCMRDKAGPIQERNATQQEAREAIGRVGT